MDILNVQSPGEIFTGDPDKLLSEYRELARQWHPDRNNTDPRANDQFAHLQELYEQARKDLKRGLWITRDTIRFAKYKAKFQRKVDLDIGTMYVGDSHITFVLPITFRRLWDNAIAVIKSFPFASHKMRQEVGRHLPVIKVAEVLAEHCILVIGKTPDLLLLGNYILASRFILTR